MPRMKHKRPARKIIGGGIAGAISTLVIYILNHHVLDVPLPADVAVAVTTLITFVTGYMVSPDMRDQVVTRRDGETNPPKPNRPAGTAP